jgi:YhcH/YjgK/YiaL family protein
MIVDRLENADLYAPLSPRFARAFAALRDHAFVNQPDGRYEIDGDRLYCLVQRYTTRPPEKCNLEAHRRYIDIQLIVSGEELIRVAPAGGLELRQGYDPGSDKALFHPREGMSSVRLPALSFALFFPQDAHMPCMQADGPAEVHKAVVKVRIGD